MTRYIGLGIGVAIGFGIGLLLSLVPKVISIINEYDILENHANIVIGLIAAIFALSGVIVSQIVQASITNKNIKAVEKNLQTTLAAQEQTNLKKLMDDREKEEKDKIELAKKEAFLNCYKLAKLVPEQTEKALAFNVAYLNLRINNIRQQAPIGKNIELLLKQEIEDKKELKYSEEKYDQNKEEVMNIQNLLGYYTIIIPTLDRNLYAEQVNLLNNIRGFGFEMNQIANTPIALKEITEPVDIEKFYTEQYQKIEDVFEKVKNENELFAQVLQKLLASLQLDN